MSMDMGTSGMDRGTSRADTGTTAAGRTPNRVLEALRRSRGWGRPRLAKEMHLFCQARQWPSPGEENIRKQIYRLESGQVRNPDAFYRRLYCQFFERSAHDLFGGINQTPDSAAFTLTSHKFIPAFVGAEAAASLAKNCSRAVDQWTDCHEVPVDDMEADGVCTLYVWPHGTVVYHLVEDLTPKSIAEIAVWRRTSYPRHIGGVTQNLEEITGGTLADPPYVLSSYWVRDLPLDGLNRETALRLLCIPRVLTSDGAEIPSLAHAELIEQALMRDGFDHPEIVDFGMRGISFGFASWSGVVYHPTAPGRALAENDLIACELSAQAAWSYCNYIRSEVERGRDPEVPEKYGWRFLRGVRSRLTTERPQETSQHRSMREAIIETSGLSRHLGQAVEILKEAGQ
ncbi:hypothetical protein [Candidatus Frankia alpina]|nr:hypothetical protein [Candidatus Frankia alpina]